MLIKHDDAINRALETVGLAKGKKEKLQVSEALVESGLGLQETFDELARIVRGSESEAIRLRAVETALKAHGALQADNANQIPQITLVFGSSEAKSAELLEFTRPPRSGRPEVEQDTNPVN